jgi:hypothetical protein
VIWILLDAVANAAPPRITEIVAANTGGLKDGVGRTPDWIEIYNPDAVPRDLSGFTLTDDLGWPTKWAFPTNTSIPAGGYLVVFASGSPRDFVDPGGWLHTPFALSEDGEYLGFRDPQGGLVQEFAPALPEFRTDVSFGEAPGGPQVIRTVVAAGAAVSWLAPAKDIGAAWRNPDFDDSAWTSAQTGIGYGYPVGPGGDTRGAMWLVNSTVYARILFALEDADSVTRLVLRMKY